MHYDTIKNQHNLPHDPFKAIVAPRPIGWIGSRSKAGIYNLAPYSYFNAIADKPHFVMFSSVEIKFFLFNWFQVIIYFFNLINPLNKYNWFINLLIQMFSYFL